jgi:heptosyltransferase-2
LPPALVIQTSFLGDTILTTPLIASLAERGEVFVVTTPSSAPILANNPDISRLLVYDKRGGDKGATGLGALARRLRGASPNAIAYCAQGSVRTAMLALLAGCKERIGFDTSAGNWLYTKRAHYRADQHHAERLLRLALGPHAIVTADLIRPRLFPGDTDRRAVDAVLGTSGALGGPLIALAPGSVWATKRWPYFADLARRLVEIGRIVVIGSGDDRLLGQSIVEATNGEAIDATGRLSLLASADLLSRCALLVTNDSAPQHLASAVDTPTITIFGPTVPAFGFGPLATGSHVAGHPALPCRPCDSHGPQSCPLGHWRCMRELDDARVAALATEVLSAPRSTGPSA